MNFFLCYFESANYAGYGEWYVVKAELEGGAVELSEVEAEDYFREQDLDQFREENPELDDDDIGACSSLVKSLEMHEADIETLRILSEKGLGNSFTCVNCEESEVVEEAKKILACKAA